MAEPTKLKVAGLKELARDLRKVDRSLAKELQQAHKRVAALVSTEAQSRARTAYGRHGSQARGIAGRATARKASIALNTGRTPRLAAAEFGARYHWVFGRRVTWQSMRRPVFPPWSGNQWQAGEGPAAGVGYAVHPTVREWVQSGRLADTYAEHVIDGFAPAFPERS